MVIWNLMDRQLLVKDLWINAVLTSPLIIIVLTVFVIIISFFKRRPSRPPGPLAIPLLGSLPELLWLKFRKKPVFRSLTTKYGPIHCIQMGTTYVVTLCNYPAMKEAYEKEEVLARPRNSSLIGFIFPGTTFATETGDLWKSHRRFIVQQMKNFGIGKHSFEEVVKDNLTFVMNHVNKNGGEPEEFRATLGIYVASNLLNFLFGETAADPKKVNFRNLRKIASIALGDLYILFLPKWIQDLPGVKTFFSKMRNAIRRREITHLEWKRAREEFKRTFDQNAEHKTYSGAYLLEMLNNANSKPYFDEAHWAGNTITLFIGGVESTRCYLEWCLLLMACHPEIQQRAYREIMDTIGQHRLPTFADHARMPYCRAVLTEAYRLKPSVPLGIPRVAFKDTTIQGYFIPKSSIVLFDYRTLYRDPKHWTDPDKFRPTRFLDETETKFLKNTIFHPFGQGKRSCPGEKITDILVFIGFISLLQQYEILPREGRKVDLSGAMGLLTFKPKAINTIRLLKRKHQQF